MGWEAIRRRVRNYMILDGPSQRLVRCGFVLTRDRLKVQSNPTRQGCLGVILLFMEKMELAHGLGRWEEMPRLYSW